jgi:Zn-dependent protease with chaperone function
MTTQGDVPAAPAPPERPRPNVLAYPSPTTWRFLVFLAALLSAGVFAGTWLHNQVLYDEWLAVTVRCNAEALRQTAALPAPESSLGRAAARDLAAARCRGPADRRMAAFALGGLGAAGAAGLIVLYLAPRVVERRRRLRPLVPGLRPAAERVAALAAEAGLPRAPGVVLGDARLRDGFSYGTPGRYRIALPRAVAVHWRAALPFDPLVRHELAHVAHRDVALAWLARSVWYALAPLLAVPLVATLLSSDRSLLLPYLWRAALFAVMVQVVSSALLRSREHDADLRAARAAGGPETVAAAVAGARDRGAAPWYRRLLANHPSPARRLAVLERPELAAGVTLLDGFTAAFLATLTVPLVVQVLTALLRGSGRSDLADVVAALIAGPLLGGAVGLGLWRAALVQRVVDGPTRPTPVALGVAAGLVLGQVASFAQTGTALGGVDHPALLVVIALAGLGATALAAGLGELWANAAPAMRHARASWVAALVVNSVLFTAVLWAAASLELALDQGSSAITRTWLVTAVASWPILTAVVVLAVTAAWALGRSRHGAVAPAWLLERGGPWPWPVAGRGGLTETAVTAVAVGLAGAGTIVGFRAVAGPAGSDAVTLQRFYTYVWVAAAAGAAAALALALLVPRRGVGAGALAGPLACLVAVTGFLAMNTAIGGGLAADFVTTTVRTPLALGLVLAVLAAPAGLLTWRGDRRLPRAWPAAAALGLVAAVTVVAGRGTLTSLVSEDTPAPPGQGRDSVLIAEAMYYVTAVAPDVLRRYQAVQAAANAINADQTLEAPTRAARVRAEVLGPLRALLADVEAYRPATPQTRSVHLTLVAALRAGAEGFETLAAGFEAGDATAVPAADAKWQQELRLLQDWGSGVVRLRTVAGFG